MAAPDGISEQPAGNSLWNRHASPVSIVLLGGILACAFAGFTGGQPSPKTVADFGRATLTVKTPLVIRNGEFFETEIEISSVAALGDATVAISADLWRDMTVNTMIPAAGEERFEEGSYRFAYGPLEAGQALRIKVDGQINPPLFAGTQGEISLYDGKRLVGRQPLRIKVLP
ncbi:hypothetical protein [Sphingopyxis sp. R3-92]|uniref:hypothetical protein n=1 Tax=Sphingopyxis sp. R3-92 TaxID=3158553 RepID=UPI003EE5F9EA